MKNKFVKTLKHFLNENYIENSKNVINDYTHYKSGDNYYPNSEWARWFLSQDRKSKEYIAYNLKTNIDFRNALLSNWYDYYKRTTNIDISYDDFINTEITIYRGETSRDIKFGVANGFNSYTTQISIAQRFARDGNGNIIELKIKPKDTYGMIDSVGNETEVLVPTKFSDEFMKRKLDDYFNLNSVVYDKLNNDEINKFSELEYNKKYEEAIDLLSHYVDKYLK